MAMPTFIDVFEKNSHEGKLQYVLKLMQYNIKQQLNYIRLELDEDERKALARFIIENSKYFAENKPNSLINNLMAVEVLTESIISDEIIENDPVILPSGYTFSADSLNRSKAPLLCPVAQTPALLDDRYENHLYAAIRHLFLQKEGWNERDLLVAFTCPLSKELLKEPRIAKDGITYEKVFIDAYLDHHHGLTPTEVKQLNKQTINTLGAKYKPAYGLYVNKFAETILAHPYFSKILSALQEDEDKKLSFLIDNSNNEKIKNLQEYFKKRAQKGSRFNTSLHSFFHKKIWPIGFDQWDKFKAVVELKETMKGRIPLLSFLKNSEYQNTREALTQGCLKEAAEPILELLKLNKDIILQNCRQEAAEPLMNLSFSKLMIN